MNKLFRAVVIIALVPLLLSSFSLNDVYASDESTEAIDKQNDNNKISLNRVKELANEIDPDLEITEEFNSDDNSLIEADSEEELKNILKELSETQQQGSLESDPNTISPLAHGSFTRKSLLDAVLTFRHITFDYTKNNGKITNVKNIKGTYTGVYVFRFQQNSASYTLSPSKKSINFSIHGYAIAGVDVKGVTIGAKYPQHWQYSYTP